MTEQDERPTGTPDPTSGTTADDAADTSVESGAGGSESEGSEQDYKALYEKSERERVRLLNERTRVEEESRKLAQERAAATPPPAGEAAREQWLRDMSLVDQLADPDTVITPEHIRAQARVQRGLIALQDMNQRESALDRALRKTPNEIRDEAEKLVRSGQVGSVELATEFLQMKAKLAERKTTEEQHEDELESKRVRKNSEPALGARQSGGEPTAKTMRRSDYNGLLTKNENNFAARLDLERRRKAGLLKVLDD